MAAADMTAWSSQITGRFKALLNIRELSDDVSEEGAEGDSDEAKLKRAAIARNRNASDVGTAHDALTTLVFNGYQDWCEYDDDDWLKNCLGQVLDDEQSRFLVSALQDAGLIDLTTAIEMMAGPYSTQWQSTAESEAAQALDAGSAVTAASGLVPFENTESWKYSRTPGTKYYVFHDDEYLFSDDKNAPLAGWATAETRDDEAAARATEWESGSGVFYTSYENPAHVDGVEYVFGHSKDGPWVLNRAEAEQVLEASRQSGAQGGVAAAGSPVEPYFDTGHFTKYENDTYLYGESADASTWFRTYQELLDSLAAPAEPASGEAEDQDDDLTDALAALFAAIPEAADLPVDELYEAILRGVAK